MAEKLKKVLCRKFPAEVHRQLKMLAAAKEITLQETIIRACEEFIERETKRGGR
jgi:hypothetical protein